MILHQDDVEEGIFDDPSPTFQLGVSSKQALPRTGILSP